MGLQQYFVLENIFFRMVFDKVISILFDCFQCMIEFISSLQFFFELNDILGEYGDGECYGKFVFYIVVSIIIFVCKVNLLMKDNMVDVY